MHKNEDEIVIALKENIEKLKLLFENTKDKNQILIEEKNELEKKLIDRELKLKNLNKEYNNFKLAKIIVASSGDAHDAKIKVNRIVREIDKCIALLNN